MDLKLTYGYPDNQSKAIGAMITYDLQTKLAKKNFWEIVENNSLSDIEVISYNIFDLSIYLIAVILKLYGNIDKSLRLFEGLYASLDNRNDSMRKSVVPHIIDCYMLQTWEYGVEKQKHNIGIQYCNKILAIDRNNYFALSNIPVFYYKAGMESQAEQYIKMLSAKYPKTTSAELGLAVFAIKNEKYHWACKNYKNAIKYKDQITRRYINDAIEFLGGVAAD